MDFAHAMIDGPALRRRPHPVLARHRHPLVPPLRRRRPPAHPEDAVRAGADRLEGAQGMAGVRSRQGGATASRSWPTKIGVPPAQLRATADRFNELARKGHDDDFNRGDSAYDNYYGDPTLPNPNLHPLRQAAVLRVPDHPRRPRHLGWAAHRRVRPGAARRRRASSTGLYAVGNDIGRGDGPQLRRRGRDHRAGHDVRLRGRQTHRRPVPTTSSLHSDRFDTRFNRR